MMPAIRKHVQTVALAGLLATLVSVSGCIGSKITRANYDKISTGMKQSEVESVLGNGQKKESAGASLGMLGVSTEMMHWQDGNRTITIMFVNDQVMMKSQAGL
jgi:hypothetical protein